MEDKKETKFDKFIKWLKDHPVIYITVLISIFIATNYSGIRSIASDILKFFNPSGLPNIPYDTTQNVIDTPTIAIQPPITPTKKDPKSAAEPPKPIIYTSDSSGLIADTKKVRFFLRLNESDSKRNIFINGVKAEPETDGITVKLFKLPLNKNYKIQLEGCEVDSVTIKTDNQQFYYKCDN